VFKGANNMTAFYVVADDSGTPTTIRVYESLDGDTWNLLSSAPPPPKVYGNDPLVGAPFITSGGQAGFAFMRYDNGFFTSVSYYNSITQPGSFPQHINLTTSVPSGTPPYPPRYLAAAIPTVNPALDGHIFFVGTNDTETNGWIRAIDPFTGDSTTVTSVSPAPSDVIRTIAFNRANGIGIMAGNNGSAWRTTDSGANWSGAGITTGHGAGVITKVAVNEVTGTWILVGYGGKISRSTDGGLNFSLVPASAGIGANDIKMAACSGGIWCVATDHNIATSLDDGLTWTDTYAAPTYNLRDLTGW
jgi:hypothetical protein